LSSTRANQQTHHATKESLLVLSCWTACSFVKQATQLAFEDKKLSMTAPDALDQHGIAMDQMKTSKEDQYIYESGKNHNLPNDKVEETSKH
jgi:hypothetical protein